METQTMPQEVISQEAITQPVQQKANNLYMWILAIIPIAGVLFAWGWIYFLAANVILCGLDEAKLKKRGYDTSKLGRLAWFLVPMYLYRRAKLLGHKPAYLILWCLTFAVSFYTVDLGMGVINTVKNGTLDGYPSKTVGEAFEGYMSNVKWEALTADDGDTYVNATGKITYDGEPATVLLQYRVDDNRFELQAFEINGQPQNAFMYGVFLSKVYE